MPRPIEALIHLDALRHNLLRCRQAADNARVWAVVKANAYGHGIERVYEALNGADGFALLDLAEAQRLRDLGWRGPILLLEGVFAARDLELCSRLGLWHSVHHEAQIDWLAGHKTLQPHTVFLKINTGMNRLGFAPERARAACARLQALPQVAEAGLMMHFATADEASAGWQQAWQCFQQATADLSGPRSVCNSAALLRHPEVAAQTDWVRPGIALYGSSPDAAEHSSAHWGLRPAMSLRSRIIAVQNLQAGQSVGYGASFTADRPMRIGIVACGYADGYPRTCPTGTPVLVDGRRTHTLGRVSMDMLAVDLSTPLIGAPPDAAPGASAPAPAASAPAGLPTPAPATQTVHAPDDDWQPGLGSEVTLWGQASCGAVLPIDEVAAAAGTLGYELMCALAQRVPVQVV